MAKKLPFDILELATLLKAGSIEKYEVHASSLAAVITQNLYVKDEIDKMFEQTLAKFDASLNEFRLALERQDACHAKEILEIQNNIEKRFNHNLYMTIGTLGALFAFTSTITTVLHYFIR